MTVEIYAQTGDLSTRDSSVFTATVNGATTAVHSHARTTSMTNLAWTSGDNVEISWLKYGTDEATSVAVQLASGTITSADIYPRDIGFDEDITAGVLTISNIPANTRLRVEVNGDRAEVLYIFAEPLKAAAPGATTSWTTLGKTATFAPGSSAITVTTHGYSGGELVHVTTSGTLPTLSGGTITVYDRYTVAVSDPSTITLTDEFGDTLTFDDAGTGTHTIYPSEWTDSVNALIFPAGEHNIGRLFDVADNCTLYLDAGSVVTGSFDLRDTDGAYIYGPGYLCGEFSTYEVAVAAASPAQPYDYSMFYGVGSGQWLFDNKVQGITVFAQPFYLMREGVWSWRNVQVLAAWTWQQDGFKLQTGRNNTAYAAEVVDCFSHTADDNIYFQSNYSAPVVSGCFLVNSSGSCFHGGYWPYFADAYAWQVTSITDCHAVHLGDADSELIGTYPTLGTHSIIRCWTDGWSSEASYGEFNVTISGLKVWGRMASRFLAIGNFQYPFSGGGGAAREQYGQLSDWTISAWTEDTPEQLSIILGRDATNTPHDITFTEVYFEGTQLTDANYSTYFDTWTYPYNITFDAEPISSSSTLVVEDGTGLATANSYCTLDEANDYHANQGDPAAWSGATTAAREDALRQATLAIDLRYGLRWSGERGSSTQALDWPRLYAYDSAGNLIASNTIPSRLKHAVAVLALLHINGETINPTTLTSADVSSESYSVGAISKSVTYIGGKPAQTRFPVVDRMLSTAGLVDYYGVGWGGSAL